LYLLQDSTNEGLFSKNLREISFVENGNLKNIEENGLIDQI